MSNLITRFWATSTTIMEKKDNPIKDKSMAFAIDIVNLCRVLQTQNEYILSKQIVRSGTSIGAMVREAEQAESKKDFIHKLSIALKEANETDYWLEVLFRTKYIDNASYILLESQISELLRLLTSIIKTTKRNLASKST